MNNFSSFASFSDDSVNDLHIPVRSFEEFITERGDLNIHFSNLNTNYVDYNTIYEKIKEKLFKINTTKEKCNIKESDNDEIKKFRDDYLSLKKSVCDIYMNLMHAETELNEAKEKYNSFCESIKNCVHFIHRSGTPDENDILIKDILEKKIHSYFVSLNLDELIIKYDNANIEFEKTKSKISIISGTILPTTICQICLEHQVDYFIDPCGHTICKNCKSVCEVCPDCHYCRTKKKCYKRIYL